MNNKNTMEIILEKISKLVNYLYLELKIGIKKWYKNMSEKTRLSLSLKLNLMYTSNLVSIFINFNIILIISTCTFIIFIRDKAIEDKFDAYSKVIVDKKILSKETIKDSDLTILNLLNSKNNIVKLTNNNGKLIYQDKYHTGKSLFDNPKIIYNRSISVYENSRDKHSFNLGFRENLSINYFLTKSIKVDNKTINITIDHNLNEDIYFIKMGLLSLLIMELLIILITLFNSSKKIKKILKPIDDMNKTVEEITINNIHTRLNISGSQNELKDLANTFNHMLDRIQDSYELQKQFVSDASHELRTPISVIQGYAKMLKRWGKDDKDVLEESIIAIETESIDMKNLIEQLLFLARSDKGTQSFNKEPFDINLLIDKIIKETKLIDENKHNVVCDRNDFISINGDRSLLKEAIRIFVDNSLKYTPEGKNILISSYCINDTATIVIKDSGIGISKEDLPKIFDRFYRADKSRTRETGGTGLGLSIAKWIILNHDGTIDVTSTLNVGTTFMIKIPIKS